MRPMTEDPTPWRALRDHLAGYFAARARGLLASEFVLSSRNGKEFGRLRIRGQEGAQFEAGNVKATIERYRMLAGDVEMLVAEPAGSSGIPKEVRCGNRLYETRFDLLRNAAVAHSSGGEVAARVAGGLTNLRYEAFFDEEDEVSLPVALFLLYRVVALRRRAFLAGVRGGEASGW
jgi:hypothetical protein